MSVSQHVSRETEIEKYVRSYVNPHYCMGSERKRDAMHDLDDLRPRGSYLDVGCGRGEMLEHAKLLGFERVRGVEVVPALLRCPYITYAVAHDLPFDDASFDVVSMFDVMEHLLPGDDELACREMNRVAKHHVILTVSNKPSRHGKDELHINRRPYEEWDALFAEWFPDCGRVWPEKRNNTSETWIMSKNATI